MWRPLRLSSGLAAAWLLLLVAGAATQRRLLRASQSGQVHVDLATALGREHVRAHFASHEHAAEAAEHEEQQARARGKGVAVAACARYHADGARVLTLLASAGVPAHVTFTSAAEQQLCFVAHLANSLDFDAFLSSPVQDGLSMATPVPSVLKMDRSIALVLDWLGGLIRPSREHHPILQDVANGEQVVLTVVHRRDWSRGGARKVQQELLSSLREVNASAPFWDHVYQASGAKRRLWQNWRATPSFSQCSPAAPTRFGSGSSSDGATTTFELQVPPAHLTPALAHCLAAQVAAALALDGTSRVALSRPLRLLNNLARGLVQSGKLTQEPLGAAGLDGTGQVVGIADTGIDENSCFFRDDVHGFVPLCSVEHPMSYPDQRKIVQYLNYSGSGGDLPDGHGSHVAGSVAGACLDPAFPAMSQYNGMAPGAKIAFFDIMDDTTTHLYVPADLAKSMFRPSYSAGARLYSNSWGGSYWYDAFAVEVDDFAYKNPSFLAIFAAGNDGALGLRTVLSPAMAKNALAVAASNTGHQDASAIDSIASFSAKGPTPDGRIKPDVTVPGASIFSVRAHKEDSAAYRSEQSEQTCDVEPKSGTSMAAPVCAGAAALVRQFFSDPLFWGSACNPSYALCSAAAHHPLLQHQDQEQQRQEQEQGKGQGQRQLEKTAGFSPPGYLVKAVMLGAAQPMRSYSLPNGQQVPLASDSSPDFYQGFGRLALGTALPLQRYSPGGGGLSGFFDLFVDLGSLNSFTQARYAVHVSDPLVPLRASLCWFDPPNQEFAARVLLHDLDLVLVDPSGNTQIFGNAGSSAGLLGARRDELNTCEQITVSAPVAVGAWTALVQSKLLTQADSQSFALAITQAGYVEPLAPSEPVADPAALSNSCFSASVQAPGSGSGALLQLDLALFSQPAGVGWNVSAGEHYELTPITIDATTGTASASASASSSGGAVLSGHMSDATVYQTQSLCLRAGCYRLSLHGAASGSMLSVPACGELLLAPLTPEAEFCLHAVETGYGAAQPVCVRRLPPVPAPVSASASGPASGSAGSVQAVRLLGVMVEDGGAGWDGGYFTVRPSPDPASSASASASLASDGSQAATEASTLVWGFEVPSPLTLPLSKSQGQGQGSSCHVVKLSLPPGADAEPMLFFDGAFALRSGAGSAGGSSDLVDWPAGDDPATRGVWQEGGKTLCQAWVNATTAFASVCVPLPLVSWSPPSSSSSSSSSSGTGTGTGTVAVDVTFYRTAPSRNASQALHLGSEQGPDLWPAYQQAAAEANLTSVARCRLAGALVELAAVQGPDSPVAQPTRRPAASPTPAPQSQSGSAPASAPAPAPVSAPTGKPPGPVAPSPPSAGLVPPGYDFSCFSSCPLYAAAAAAAAAYTRGSGGSSGGSSSNAVAAAIEANTVCAFLSQQVYPLCGSFSLAHGHCSRPACAARCSQADWCFFGAATVAQCAFEQGQGYRLVDGSGAGAVAVAGFDADSEAVRALASACVLGGGGGGSGGNATQSQDGGSGSAGAGAADAAPSPEEMFVLVVLQMLGLWAALEWLRGAWRCQGQGQGQGQSQGQEQGQGQGQGQSQHQGGADSAHGLQQSPERRPGLASLWRSARGWAAASIRRGDGSSSGGSGGGGSGGSGGSRARHTRLADDSGHSLSLSTGAADIDSSMGGGSSSDGGSGGGDGSGSGGVYNPVHRKGAFSIINTDDDEEEDDSSPSHP